MCTEMYGISVCSLVGKIAGLELAVFGSSPNGQTKLQNLNQGG